MLRLRWPCRHMQPFAFVLICALTLGAGRAQFAPFALVHAEPAAGAVFSDAPTRIRLIFSEQLQASKGEVSLIGGDGRKIGVAAAIDPHLVDAIIAPVPPLPPGAYHVQWSVVSERGASLSGSYTFAFGPGASLPPSDDGTNFSSLDALLARTGLSPAVLRGVELLLAVALVGLVIARRRSRRMT